MPLFQPGIQEPQRALAHTAARPVAGAAWGRKEVGGVGKKKTTITKGKCIPLPGVRIVFQGGRRGEFINQRLGTPQPSFLEPPYRFSPGNATKSPLPAAPRNRLESHRREASSLQNAVMLEKRFECTRCEQEEPWESLRRKIATVVPGVNVRINLLVRRKV